MVSCLTMKPISQIESRFLRKAWFVILQNIENQLPKYRKELSNIYNKLAHGDFVDPVDLSAITIIKNDPIESEWIANGINFEGQLIKIKYNNGYTLRGDIAVACQAIQIITIQSVLISKPRKTANPQSTVNERNEKRRGGRVINKELHLKLGINRNGENPFLELTTSELSKEAALLIIQLAIEWANNSEDKKMLMAIANEFKAFQSSSSRDNYQYLWTKHSNYWKLGILEPHLLNSRWFCFRRTDASKTKGKGLGISISPVIITSDTDGRSSLLMISQSINTKGDPRTVIYEGLATADTETKHLIADLRRPTEEEVASIAFFTMTITSDVTQNLVVGHFTYFSALYGRFLTKMAVWLKMEDFHPSFFANKEYDKLSQLQLTQYAIDLTSTGQSKQKFNEIPILIRKFLSHRDFNRMTQPSVGISHLYETDDSLEKWLSPKFELDVDERLMSCCGEYEVYYYFGKDPISEIDDSKILKNTRVDKLFFKYDENYTAFYAVYEHRRSNTAKFTGTASRRQEVIQIVVQDNDNAPYKTVTKNIIYVAFAIPTADPKFFAEEIQNVTDFHGVITGVNDRPPTPISFKIYLRRLTDQNRAENFVAEDPGNPTTAKVLQFLKTHDDQQRIDVNPYNIN